MDAFDMLEQYIAQQRAKQALWEAARDARLARINAMLKAPAKPATVIGAIAPMSDYIESSRNGWSTD